MLLECIASKKAKAVIPPKENRKEQRAFDRHHYKSRNLIERFFAHIKQFRRVAVIIPFLKAFQNRKTFTPHNNEFLSSLFGVNSVKGDASRRSEPFTAGIKNTLIKGPLRQNAAMGLLTKCVNATSRILPVPIPFFARA